MSDLQPVPVRVVRRYNAKKELVYMEHLYTDSELPLVDVLIGMESEGVRIDVDALREILAVNTEYWLEDVESIKALYARFGDELPPEMAFELLKLENNLKK